MGMRVGSGFWVVRRWNREEACFLFLPGLRLLVTDPTIPFGDHGAPVRGGRAGGGRFSGVVGAGCRGEGLLGLVETGQIGRHKSYGLGEDSSEFRVREGKFVGWAVGFGWRVIGD